MVMKYGDKLIEIFVSLIRSDMNNYMVDTKRKQKCLKAVLKKGEYYGNNNATSGSYGETRK